MDCRYNGTERERQLKHEKIVLHDHLRFIDWGPSINGQPNPQFTFDCPVCKTQQKEPAHGRKEECVSGCGAKWISWGNDLKLFRRRKAGGTSV
jgi:hypothetical protein